MKVLILLLVLGASQAQPFYCDCGVFVDYLGFPPYLLGPLHIISKTNATCDDPGDTQCERTCENNFRDFVNSGSLTDPRANDTQGRTWGQYFCDEALSQIDPEDRDYLTAELESWHRIEEEPPTGLCDHSSWVETDDEGPTVLLCCDQNGVHVPDC